MICLSCNLNVPCVVPAPKMICYKICFFLENQKLNCKLDSRSHKISVTVPKLRTSNKFKVQPPLAELQFDKSGKSLSFQRTVKFTRHVHSKWASFALEKCFFNIYNNQKTNAMMRNLQFQKYKEMRGFRKRVFLSLRKV